uniref:DUF834 domain-containing protein n=1 Tax=Oryza meridionalis TaxID=40149 RepID=A0A0E0CIA5_9ORYZ
MSCRWLLAVASGGEEGVGRRRRRSMGVCADAPSSTEEARAATSGYPGRCDRRPHLTGMAAARGGVGGRHAGGSRGWHGAKWRDRRRWRPAWREEVQPTARGRLGTVRRGRQWRRPARHNEVLLAVEEAGTVR